MADDKKVDAPDAPTVFGKILREIPSSDLAIVYSNYATLSAAPEEFVFRFCQRSLVEEGDASEVVRVYMPIGHAKRLLYAMSRSLKAYEDLFGEVPAEPILTPKGRKMMGLPDKSNAND